MKMPLDSNEAQIIVFTPGPVKSYLLSSQPSYTSSQTILDGDWEFELKPTMDNRWGDFRLPVTEKIIGAEARIFRYSEEKPGSKGCEQPGFDDSKWEKVTYGFGQKFWKLGPLPDNIDKAKVETGTGTAYKELIHQNRYYINGMSLLLDTHTVSRGDMGMKEIRVMKDTTG